MGDIIAFGDFVNHAIFTFTEFSAATEFLLERGAISLAGNSLKASAGFRAWYRKHIPSAAWPNYGRERKLFAEYLTLAFPEKNNGKSPFSEQEFRSAVDSYLLNGQ